MLTVLRGLGTVFGVFVYRKKANLPQKGDGKNDGGNFRANY